MKRLVYYELRKVFLRWPMLILLLVFSVMNLAKIANVYQEGAVVAYSDEVKATYLELYEEYKGEITTEKAQEITTLYREVEDLLSDFTINPVTDDSLTGNLMMDDQMLQYCFYEPMEYLYTYKSMAEEMIELAEDNQELYAELGNEYEYKKNAAIAELFSGRSMDEFYTVTGYQFYFYYDFSLVLAILIILYGLSQVFSRDKECGMDILLVTTQHGGVKTMAAKVVSSSLFLTAVTLWFALMDYVGFSLIFGLGEAGSLPVYAVQNFAASPISLTLNQYWIVCVLCKVLGFWTLGMVFLLVAQVSRNALIPFVCNGILFLGVVIAGMKWSESATVAAKVWNPYSLLINRILFNKIEFINLFDTPVPSWAVTIAAALGIGVCAMILLILSGSRKSKLQKGVGS